MVNAKFAKALAAVALFNAVLVLSGLSDAYARNNEDDAKKYTLDLKKGKDAKVKVMALQELGKLAALKKSYVADALDDIYKALEDKDASIRAAAANCLGACDEPADKAIPALVKLLKDDKEETVKIGAAKGLAAMGPGAKSAIPDLRAVAKDADKKGALAKNITAAMKAIGGKN